MNFARTCLPKSRAKLFVVVVGAACFLWTTLSFGFPSSQIPLHPHTHSDRHGSLFPNSRPYPPPRKPTIWNERAHAVKTAFLHAYDGYKQHAAGHDELLPLTDGFVDNFNGWGVTLIDALDTMWIMGLHEQFQESLPVVANLTFALPESQYAPFFETVIRYLGGLLSAYALSGESLLLSRADDLGEMLLPVFNTRHGLPMYAINTVTGVTRAGWASNEVLWAEALSCQLEYKYLAHLTGRKQYFTHVEHIMDIMQDAKIEDGRFPTKWRMTTARPSTDHFSVGAFADSAHEYLLKQWLMTGKSESKARDLYLKAVNGIIKHLLYLTPTRNLLYVTDTIGHFPSHTFEHLSCFLPGLLTLGAHTLPLSAGDKEMHIWAAQGLAYTCWMTYADQPSGLGPDEMSMQPWVEDEFQGRWLPHYEKWRDSGKPGGVPPGLKEVTPQPVSEERDYSSQKPGYLLRPETVESFHLLWSTTRDEIWRERGWAVFEAIEREAKTESGYASIDSVESSPAKKKNEMPSFFMAETLKYLYLLFSDNELIPLHKWVFNTEAHPLPVFQWADWEVERYNISIST